MKLREDVTQLTRILAKHDFKNEKHVILPDRLFKRAEGLSKFAKSDQFGCVKRFLWMKNLNLIRGKTLVDLAGSSGFFSIMAVDEKVVSSAAVYDIDENSLAVGNLTVKILKLADQVSFHNKSLELNALNELPDADVAFCLNLLHHAGIEFDQSLVEKEGWIEYSIKYLKQLRPKYNQMVISLAFKGPHKPVGLRIPYHRFEDFFIERILKQAGWECISSTNVARLGKKSTAKKSPFIRKIKNISIDIIWFLFRRWGFTKKMTHYLGLVPKGKLSKYFIFMAD